MSHEIFVISTHDLSFAILKPSKSLLNSFIHFSKVSQNCFSSFNISDIISFFFSII